ncbi:MAG: glycosyltransferase [Bacteroidales bacterium]
MKKPKVLVAPLNWGLGHASRVIPIIDRLIKANFSVIIAADGAAFDYLCQEFPNLQTIKFPDLKIKYSKKHLVFKIFLQSPKIIYNAFVEHYLLKKIIKKHHIGLVISDNRFGLWNKHTYNIFISHQLNLIFPKKLSFFTPVYQAFLKSIIKKYDECWVPDFPGNHNLSGYLSHPALIPSKTKYIGPISRFNRYHHNALLKTKYDLLFILSGPEPQRTIFENIILKQIKNRTLRTALVRGTQTSFNVNSSVDVYNVVHSEQLFKLMQQSKLVVCRSGYSSIMDLIIAKKNAILVPTPGQTEQEYLANHLKSWNQFYFVLQQNFNLDHALLNGQLLTTSNLELENNVDQEINRLKLLMQ